MQDYVVGGCQRMVSCILELAMQADYSLLPRGFRIFEGRSLQSQDGAPCDPFVTWSKGHYVVRHYLPSQFVSCTMASTD